MLSLLSVLSVEIRLKHSVDKNHFMERSPIVRLSGVYNADAGAVGELRYFFDKVTGRSSCSLCDITHGTKIRGKGDWRDCQSSLPVPLDTFHRNDQPADIASFTAGLLPCVVARHEDGSMSLAVSADQLAECNHEVAAFESIVLKLF